MQASEQDLNLQIRHIRVEEEFKYPGRTIPKEAKSNGKANRSNESQKCV